jgi:hypothetical protein
LFGDFHTYDRAFLVPVADYKRHLLAWDAENNPNRAPDSPLVCPIIGTPLEACEIELTVPAQVTQPVDVVADCRERLGAHFGVDPSKIRISVDY